MKEKFKKNNIVLYSDFDGIHVNHCLGSQIENNTCVFGIRYGMALYYSNYTLLTNNTFSEYRDHGICFASGTLQHQVSHCEISRNMIRNNTNYGIKIDIISSNNTFHHNSFVDNGLSPQAYDSFTNNNTWYDTTTEEGNYWSDHSGCEPYILAGGDGDVSDPFPLDENLTLDCNKRITFSISLFLLIGAISLLMITIIIIRGKNISILKNKIDL